MAARSFGRTSVVSLVVTLALASSLILSGCIFAAPAPAPAPAPALDGGVALPGQPTSAAEPAPLPTQGSGGPVFVPIDQVVATGTFESRGSDDVGTVVVVSRGDGTFDFRVAEVTLPKRSGTSVVFTTERVTTDDECFHGYLFDAFALEDVTRAATLLGQLWQTTEDPSFIDSVLISVSGDNCAEVVAVAKLEWTMPDTRPGLSVSELGAARGADGELTLRTGKPFSYLVRQGDTLEGIAARFGMSVSDLKFLNPRRGNAELQADETLNLNRARR